VPGENSGNYPGGPNNPFKPAGLPNNPFKQPVPSSIKAPKSVIKSSSAPRTRTTSNSGGGGGGDGFTSTGGGGGGGGGGFSPAAFVAPDPNAWKTDSTYMSQVAALVKALSDYQAQKSDTETRYNADYTNRTNDLGIERGFSLDANNNDYASRGLYNSGLQAQATGNLMDSFSRRQADMATAKSNYLAGLQRDFTNFQSEQDLTRQKAQQDAIARAAAGVMI
jgi:hypothetical protein